MNEYTRNVVPVKMKRFKYLKEKGVSDSTMFDIVKYSVIPSFNISFEEVILYTILLVPLRKQFRYPVWELYINILILKYKIPKNTVEEAVKIGICKANEEIQKRFERFMDKYHIVESKKK